MPLRLNDDGSLPHTRDAAGKVVPTVEAEALLTGGGASVHDHDDDYAALDHAHAGGSHPDLAAHTDLGLATAHAHDFASTGHHHDAAYAATGHAHAHNHDASYAATGHTHAASGGEHPDLAAHETLGLVTDADLTTHAATAHGLSAHAIDGAFHTGTSVLPTAGQKNALAGTTGTPGDTNRYVTHQDSRLADARTPTAHGHAIADTTNLQATLDSKAAASHGTHLALGTTAGTAAEGNHSHAGGAHPDLAAHDALGLATQAEVDGKAATGHNHDAAYAPTHSHPYEASGAVAAHAGLADPHPTYLTAAEGNAAYEASGAVSAHAGAANPHPTYATDADLTAHTGAADPHPGYLTPAEHSATDHTGIPGVGGGGGSAPRTTITADVVNNNAVANTLQDVTGLSFPVTAGTRYWFRFVIPYTAAAGTTGSRWTLNGPATSFLSYRSSYTLTATSRTFNEGLNAYNTPAASNATSLATGNLAEIEGYITPSANGTVIARFASEVQNSAITAKAGATVFYQPL